MRYPPDPSLRDSLIEDLRALIKIPSRSFPDGGEEEKIQARVEGSMRGTGARVRTFEVKDVPGALEHPLWCGPGRNYAGRPTVVGEFGPKDAPSLMVLAHSDTVLLDRLDEWTCDPFGAEVRNGRVMGLGAGDDKWGVAAIITLMRAFAPIRDSLRRRLTFVSTFDEEHGVGNGLLLLMLAGLTAEAALYLDANEKKAIIGNPGGSNMYLRPKENVPLERLADHEQRLRAACGELSRERLPLFNIPSFAENRVTRNSVVFYRKQDAAGPFFLIAFYQPPGEGRTEITFRLNAMVQNAIGEENAWYAASYREPWFEGSVLPLDAPILHHLSAAYLEVTKTEITAVTGGKQDSFVFRNHAKIPTVSFGVSKVGKGGFHQPDEQVEIEDAWTAFRVAHQTIWNWLEGV